jgi:ATP-dependent RNA helicase DeaD
MTTELAEKLEARGYASAALSGDMAQKQREKTVALLKKGRLDILVATDVAARGLDIDRISHVINFDIPSDVEAYIHRIGRTGRAGRSGEAVLFVAPRERKLLYAIERATQQKIPRLELPSTEMINDQRIAHFKQAITDTLDTENLGVFRMVLEQYRQEHNTAMLDIASALAKIVRGDEPLLLPADVERRRERPRNGTQSPPEQMEPAQRKNRHDKDSSPEKTVPPPPEGMERFRVSIGHVHGLKPGNLVGAIANEAELDSQYIGRIEIYEDHSTVDLPEGMPRDLHRALKKVWVCGEQLQLVRIESDPSLHSDKRFKGNSKKKSSKKNRHRKGKNKKS